MSHRNDCLVGRGEGRVGLSHQAIEWLATGAGGPPVESEGEFVELVVQVGVLDGTLVGT